MKRVHLFVVTALSVLACLPLPAQEARGRILGRITDASGAVVAEAVVRITNTATNQVASVVTNDHGNFQAPFLVPGPYSVHVEKAGFRRVVRDNIEVRVDDRLEINIILEIGEVTETVNVSAEVPLLETSSASLGQVVDSRRISELPLAHGVPFHLIAMAPGAMNAAPHSRFDQPYAPSYMAAYSIDGTRSGRNELTLDGVPNTSTGGANEVISSYVPPADIVAEFKVQTASFDASVGQTEGGVVNVSLKSGTNQLHGTAQYVKMDPVLEANSFLANRAGQPKGDYSYDRYGATLNGPMYIPKVYDGHNRTFFLYGYEAIGTKYPRGTILTVPTEKQRQGDLSDLLRLGNAYQIYDPGTRRAAPNGRFQSEPFPGNIIPASRISPVSRNILNYYPLPTTAGTADGRNNLPLLTKTEDLTYYTHTARVDHNVSSNYRMFARVNVYKRDSYYDDWFENAATGSGFQFLSRGAAFDHVYTFSPTLVMNVRYGFNRFVRAFDASPESQGFDLTNLGFPASYSNSIDTSVRRFPHITMSNFAGTYGSGRLWGPTDIHTLQGSFDKVYRNHTFKFGGEYRLYRENRLAYPNATTGRFNFTDTWTRGPFDNSPAAPLGQDLAGFLLGLPAGGWVDVNDSFAEQSTVTSLFLQDDWKVSRGLTISLGLRYELEGPLTERHNRSVRHFDYGAPLPIAAQAQANYARNPTPEIQASQFQVGGGLTFAGVGGNSRTLFARDKNNFMPRIGIAYSLTNKTVLRLGYGIFYGFLGQRRGDVIQTGYSHRTELVPSLDGGLSFLSTLSNPFPNGIITPPGSSLGAATNLGNPISFFDPNPAAPYMQRWQLSIQRTWGSNVVSEVAYVGNRGTQIINNRQFSALPNEYLSTSPVRDNDRINYLSTNLPNPFFPMLPGTGRASSVISRAALLSPFPQFNGVSSTTNQGYSWYHSLQARIEKRFSRSFTVQASYTFSRFMEAVGYLNGADPMPEEVVSDQDFPHRLAASGIWELPFGRGKQWLNSGGFANKILGGWQIQGVYQAQSGQALGFGNAIFTGRIEDIVLPRGQRTAERWFNTDVGFDRVATRQLAFNRRALPSRFSAVRRGRINNWDLSVIKNTPIRENVRMQLRGEFLNALNHPMFANPNTSPVSTAFGTVNSENGYPRRIQLSIKLVF